MGTKCWMTVVALSLSVGIVGFGSGGCGKHPAADNGDAGAPDAEPSYPRNDFTVCDEVVAFRLRAPCDQVEDRVTWYVKKDATGDFTAINDAIDAASHCDTIIVGPGIYHEGLRIEDKDLVIKSDVNDEHGAPNGDEEVPHEARFLDLVTYWDTGTLEYTETVTTHRPVLRRAARTVINGSALQTNVPIVGFMPGCSRDSVLDGFTIEMFPELNHSEPGHAHVVDYTGSSPVIINNILRHNGTTAVGGHAAFINSSADHPHPHPHDPSADHRFEAIQYRPAPLVMYNLIYCNNGAGIGSSHYSCTEAYENEVLWSHMPRTLGKSPGIGSTHGAKTRIERNIVYENAWVGIGCRQGEPDGDSGKHVNERTLCVIRDNLVWDNGWPDAPGERRANIGVDGCGLPDVPVLVEGNVVSGAGASGIGIRNEYSGPDYPGTSTYVTVVNNESFQNTTAGIGCSGNDVGPAVCEIRGNVVHDNMTVGISVNDGAEGLVDGNESYDNATPGIVVQGGSDGVVHDNVCHGNGSAGIVVQDWATAQVYSNRTHQNGTGGIVVQGDAYALVHHNECYLNLAAGIRFDTGATGEIYHCVLDRNGTAGVSIQGAVSIINNIIRHNGTSGIVDPGCSNYSYNIISGNNGQADDCGGTPHPSCINPQTAGCGMTEGCIFVDPGFVDPDAFDYNLRFDSLAIDAGLDLGLFPFTGSGPDIGRFEYGE